MNPDDLLKHYVRLKGWVGLVTRGGSPVNRYFTFCTQEAVDVFTLAKHQVLQIQPQGRNLGFCEKESGTAVQLQGKFPRALVLRGNFSEILLTNLVVSPARSATGNMSTNELRLADLAEMKRQLTCEPRYDFLNIDVYDTALPTAATVWDNTFLKAVTEMLVLQRQARPRRPIYLSITSRLHPVSAPFLDQLRRLRNGLLPTTTDWIEELASLMPFWYVCEVLYAGFSVSEPSAYFYRRRTGEPSEYGIHTWMAKLEPLPDGGSISITQQLERNRALQLAALSPPTNVDIALESVAELRDVAQDLQEVRAFALNYVESLTGAHPHLDGRV